MRSLKKYLIILGIFLISSCDSFLDIVPDNIPTIDQAFNIRSTAERYLYTCYSYLTNTSNIWSDPLIWGADEAWLHDDYSYQPYLIAKNSQNINNPLLNYWGGYPIDVWEAISQCNIFLENIDNVRDMDQYEKDRWKAEVTYLKAFYHFFMLRSYGPIPIIDKNIPISASGEEVRVFRKPIDEVFEYIVSTIDKAIPNLPDNVTDESSELGRITKAIGYGMKAKILVYAASPLFNGNTDYSNFKNKDESLFFNLEYDHQRWQKAVDACREAIEYAESIGHQLFEFEKDLSTLSITEETQIQMNYRGVNTERWNKEILWANSGRSMEQPWFAPKGLYTAQRNYTGTNGTVAVTLNLVNQFYTKNGVPINEDISWDYPGRLKPRIATEEDIHKVKPGETTASYNFDREPRFYGGLGFDRGVWFGNGVWDDTNPYWLQMRLGEWLGVVRVGHHPITGYFIKKLVNHMNRHQSASVYNAIPYPRVLLRLSDLYLLYAEALNELNGPSDESILYLDKIRSIAGIPDVKTSWSNYSRIPNKYTTKEGLRAIIHQERAITLLLEGDRFWDLRRWKTAPIELNKPIIGWDVYQSTYEGYYREKVLYNSTFTLKDYFWPISEADLIINRNLVQNPGW